MAVVADSPEELRARIRQYDAESVYTGLAGLAARHIEASPLFTALPYDATSPAHDLTVVSLEPRPDLRGIDAIKDILNDAYPPWREVIEPVIRARPDLINDLVNRIQTDKISFSLMLAHERIEDVAYVMAVLLVVLSDHIPYSELVQKFHIVISSIVRTMGTTFGLSAVDILRMAGWVHFSFPRTDSVKQGGFDEALMSDSNKLMRLELGEQPAGIVTAIAAPGSIDRVLNLPESRLRRLPAAWKDRHRTVHIQPVGRGTARLLEGYVLPVAGVFSGERQFCELGRLTVVSNHQDVHDLMHWIAERRHSNTLVPTYYHEVDSSLTKFKRLFHSRP